MGMVLLLLLGWLWLRLWLRWFSTMGWGKITPTSRVQGDLRRAFAHHNPSPAEGLSLSGRSWR